MRFLHRYWFEIVTALVTLFVSVVALSAPPSDQIQYCGATPTATTSGNLLGCPSNAILWGPVFTNDWVRTSVNGSQKWATFNTLTPSALVYSRNQTGHWVALSQITLKPAPQALPAGWGTPVAPPVTSPPTTTPPASSTSGYFVTITVNGAVSPTATCMYQSIPKGLTFTLWDGTVSKSVSMP